MHLRSVAFGVVLLGLVAGNAGADPAVVPSGQPVAPSSAPLVTMPANIDVRITSAEIAPTKLGNPKSPWDGPGSVSPQADAAITKGLMALASKAAGVIGLPSTAVAALAAMFKDSALSAIAKPDVFGSAELAASGVFDGTRIASLGTRARPSREFRPSFAATFTRVPWNEGMRLRAVLTDKDLVNDDKIGTVEITSAGIREAYRVGKPLTLYVGDQDTGNVLTLTISVSRR